MEPESDRLDLAAPDARRRGGPFLEAVALELARLLEADGVGIGESAGPGGERVRCIAFCLDGRLVEGPLYELEGTPCADIVGRTACVHPRGVAERFPEDPALREVGAQGYAGTPLWSVDARPLGILFAVFRRPLAAAEAERVRTLLPVVATGVAAELERGSTDEALRESERRLEAIFDQAAVGLAEADARTGRFLRVNRALCTFLGRTPAELKASTVEDVTHPDDRERTRRNLQRLADWDAPDISFEKAYLRRDGEVVWGRTTVLPLGAARGAPATWMGLVEDITERKQAEAALRQAQKMEAVGRLAGGIAHDFNNLLTAIGGYVELLRERLPEGDPARAELEEIARAGERGGRLTGQLLAFGRRQALAPGALEPGRVVRELGGLLARALGERIRLVTELDPAARRIRADRTQLEQILLNLAVNARDAMPEGGELRIATRDASEGEVALSAPPEGPAHPAGYGVLEVSDTGTGMDRPTLDQAFEPFFTTKGPEAGTGLGLATVYGIVKQSGGGILVESRPGAGTTFRIVLPGAEGREEAPALPAAAEGAGPPGTGTILWVEDEPAVRRWVSALLRRAGYRVIEADRPARAVELAREEDGPIDALVSDVVMPGMTGPELGERLLGLRPGLARRMLFVSGYSAVEPGRRAVPGSAPFLQKPFRARELLARLRDLLSEAPAPAGAARAAARRA